MASISSHGGLVHVVMNVKLVTSEGITALVTNSPNLLTFHAFTDDDPLNQDLALKSDRLIENYLNVGVTK